MWKGCGWHWHAQKVQGLNPPYIIDQQLFRRNEPPDRFVVLIEDRDGMLPIFKTPAKVLLPDHLLVQG